MGAIVKTTTIDKHFNEFIVVRWESNTDRDFPGSDSMAVTHCMGQT